MRADPLPIATVVLACMLSWPAGSDDGGTKRAPLVTVPPLGEIPNPDGLKPPQPERAIEPTSRGEPQFFVVKVEHAKAFKASGTGHMPVGRALAAISLSGKPPATEKFSTLVRVRSPQKTNAPIQVAVTDARGEPLMSAAGELSFRGAKGEEAEYLVDWDPTPCRSGGAYQVAVRVAGQELGSWPLQVLEPTPQSAIH
jgi:hypothetical protein